MQNKIRVGIRGISGHLGNRLAMTIKKQDDMELVFGIAKNDASLGRILNSVWAREVLPQNMFLDNQESTIEDVNCTKAREFFRFQNTENLNLSEMCDILIDATSPGSRGRWDQKYAGFGKPVVLQSGEYPEGVLITPPLIQKKEGGNIYRQGDCLMSALSPVLNAISSVSDYFRIQVLMQFTSVLRDYPTNQRTSATYIRDDLGSKLEEELQSLFPEKEMFVDNLLQVPGLEYYTITLVFNAGKSISGADLKQKLIEHPRIFVVPSELKSSYELDHFIREEARAFGKDISPVAVYGCDLDFREKKTSSIRLRIAVYYKMVAVLPNIDSIRILCTKVSPVEAMRMTDRYAGFN